MNYDSSHASSTGGIVKMNQLQVANSPLYLPFIIRQWLDRFTFSCLRWKYLHSEIVLLALQVRVKSVEFSLAQVEFTTDAPQTMNQNLRMLRYENSRPKMFNQVIFQKFDSKIFSRFDEYFRDES